MMAVSAVSDVPANMAENAVLERLMKSPSCAGAAVLAP
jgi:hypothetical protein